MLVLPIDATDDQLCEAACKWVELFADNRTDEAFSLLAANPANDWSVSRIKAAVSKFKPDHPSFGEDVPRITRCSEAKIIPEFDHPLLDGPCHLVLRWIPGLSTPKYPGRIGVVHFELPINGYWSAAMVLFLIKKLSENELALELHDFFVEDP